MTSAKKVISILSQLGLDLVRNIRDGLVLGRDNVNGLISPLTRKLVFLLKLLKEVCDLYCDDMGEDFKTFCWLLMESLHMNSSEFVSHSGLQKDVMHQVR